MVGCWFSPFFHFFLGSLDETVVFGIEGLIDCFILWDMSTFEKAVDGG